MARDRRKRPFLGKYVVLISSVVMLNFMGISYANWNDQLEISTSLSTGKIEPVFCTNVAIDKVKGNGEIEVNFDDKYTMDIQGKISPDYKAFIHYCVINEGTLPVKYVGHPQNLHDGLKIQVNQQSGILDPREHFFSETGNPKLQIDAAAEGKYEFEIELPFSQWIRP